MRSNIHNPGPINLADPNVSPKMRTKVHKNTQKTPGKHCITRITSIS